MKKLAIGNPCPNHSWLILPLGLGRKSTRFDRQAACGRSNTGRIVAESECLRMAGNEVLFQSA